MPVTLRDGAASSPLERAGAVVTGGGIPTRARHRVEASTPRFETSRGQRDELARRFFAACEQGDMDGLLDLLTADVVFVGDGGGKGQGLREPASGGERVARLLLGLFARGAALGASIRPVRARVARPTRG